MPDYAGHADAAARRLSDQQVRAWVGEQLVDLEDRLPVERGPRAVEALLMRCEFADQHVIHAIEDDRFGAGELCGGDRGLRPQTGYGRRRVRDGDGRRAGRSIDAIERAFDERAAGSKRG